MAQDRRTFRFLHAADLHLDSRLDGLGSREDAPVDRLRGATRVALENLVRKAVQAQVDFVVLAGDVYDGDWRDFNTGLFFRGQLVQLQTAGIPVFLIHGNHDADSIISKELPVPDGVTVFGSSSASSVSLEGIDVTLHGQSYATRDVSDDLAARYPDPVAGHFNIGVLHTALTGREGHANYAPTSLETLCERGYDYFALGHVHTREVVREADPRIVFPGNVQGRHARETGPKGCELVTVDGGRIVDSEFIALDVVRWHSLRLSIDGIDTLEAYGRAFTRLVDDSIERDERLHAVRVEVIGNSTLQQLEAREPGTLQAALRAALQDVAQVELWLEKVKLSLHASIGREVARERDDAIGDVIREVERLQNDEAALADWFARETADLKSLPPELGNEDPSRYSPEAMRDALLGAEATILASLSSDVQDDL